MFVLTIAIMAFVLVCFAGVILFGAPYLPTLKPQIEATFELAGLKSGDTILELGCGDGRILIAAAKLGVKAIGYELNPILAFVAWARTRRYGKQVKVVCGDFWGQTWPPADAIFVFLLAKYMKKLDNKCMQYTHKPVKLVSFAFRLPDRKPDKIQNGLFLYDYH
jgi:SAM-dependent methyltransferase